MPSNQNVHLRTSADKIGPEDLRYADLAGRGANKRFAGSGKPDYRRLVGRLVAPVILGIAVIIGILKPSNRFVLIRQFRPAINNFVLGFPAGISEGKDISEEALRELKEETGYIGRIVELSPAFKLSAALIDDDVHVVSAEIDENDPGNKKPVQELEPEEEIEVVLCEKRGIKDLILNEIKAGRTVASGVWNMAIGS